MKKGKMIQDIKTNTSWPVLISTLFYVLLASLFIEGGLWSMCSWVKSPKRKN